MPGSEKPKLRNGAGSCCRSRPLGPLNLCSWLPGISCLFSQGVRGLGAPRSEAVGPGGGSHPGKAKINIEPGIVRDGRDCYFYSWVFGFVSIRELFGMAGGPRFRRLGVPGRGVRRGSGGPPNPIQIYICIAVQTTTTCIMAYSACHIPCLHSSSLGATFRSEYLLGRTYVRILYFCFGLSNRK